ncbi:hypothetical protein [Nonomuraea jiangxiensis]|uniref:Uncharacterized protein n=1 Tax=Nonomuraea jiangxiensis TaxID=633440 RepID=A0A1G8JAN6_9ACTN|nr:hypothetical protein [Nonomuraea jiangxiensis]SDI27690.1 hypothetical protein SAMN05421869_10517 [Nonomuraea jiangxiensis]
MKIRFETTRLRTGVIAAAVLAGGLLTATPAGASTVSGQSAATSVTLSAETAAAARPSNGRILYHRFAGGPNRLKIKNGTSRDGVVALVKGKSKAISIYVRAKSTATIKDVRDGTYRIYFTTGTQFSVSKGRFGRGAVYQRFDDQVRFRSSATQYTIYTLTLNPVRGGNAHSSAVNPKDFPA